MPMKHTRKNTRRNSSRLPLAQNPKRNAFTRFSFLIRRSEMSSKKIKFIWSIENHVILVKWIATRINGQFQITNRYSLWNSSETDRYVQLAISDSKIISARGKGMISL
ncbi:unnamed protein product [Caenorhabditis brenneri]